MAKNTPAKKTMTPFEKSLTAIIVIVVLAVLAFAVTATYSKIADNVAQQRLEDEAAAIARGEKPANIRYLASTAGMTPEEYVAQYGLELTDDFTEDSEINDMLERMTLENYFKFNDEGAEEPTDVDALLKQWNEAGFSITKDTLWSEVESTVSIVEFVGEEQFNNMIEQYESYGYDLSTVTADMPLKDANDAIQEIVNNGPTLSPKPIEDTADTADTADTEAADEAPAE